MAAYTVSKVDVWVGTIRDRPGGVAEKLEALARAGANLEFVISRRAPDNRAEESFSWLLLRGPLRREPLERQA